MTKKLKEVTTAKFGEEIRIWIQSFSGSKAELLQHLTDSLEKIGLDPVTYIFEVEDAMSTEDVLMQTFEKLAEIG